MPFFLLDVVYGAWWLHGGMSWLAFIGPMAPNMVKDLVPPQQKEG
jgi:hypothetical protein